MFRWCATLLTIPMFFSYTTAVLADLPSTTLHGRIQNAGGNWIDIQAYTPDRSAVTPRRVFLPHPKCIAAGTSIELGKFVAIDVRVAPGGRRIATSVRNVPDRGPYFHSDWSTLGDGKAHIREQIVPSLFTGSFDSLKEHNPIHPTSNEVLFGGIGFQPVVGESVRIAEAGLERYELRDVVWDVSFEATEMNFFGTTLIALTDIEEVSIENVAIRILNDGIDASGNAIVKNILRIQDCKTVTLKNVFLWGPADYGAVRLDNNGDITIDGLYVSGIHFGDPSEAEKSHVGTMGLSIFHDGLENPDTDSPKELGRLIASNLLFEDYTANPCGGNHSAIAAMGIDGIFFNAYIDNYGAAEAIDLGHRNSDSDFHGNAIVLARSVINNSGVLKTSGGTGVNPDNAVLLVGNIIRNSFSGSYHDQFDVFYVNNTIVKDDSHFELHDAATSGRGYKLWRSNENGLIHFVNNLVYMSDVATSSYWYNGPNDADYDAWESILQTDFNTYLFPRQTPQVLGVSGDTLEAANAAGYLYSKVIDFMEWQSYSGNDLNSGWFDVSTDGIAAPVFECFLDFDPDLMERQDYALAKHSVAVDAGCGKSTILWAQYQMWRNRIDPLAGRDFSGTIRDASPDCGAYERP